MMPGNCAMSRLVVYFSTKALLSGHDAGGELRSQYPIYAHNRQGQAWR
ncbi:MAG: hypothetical protein IJG65_00455 [Synergistaceae bacterium]|nr:hypothetical protein [Synergistaceae bacterium]